MLWIDEENVAHDDNYFMSPDCDSFDKVKITRYFGISQEVAGAHAGLLGCGMGKMLEEEGRTWMILRTKMTINRVADWLEEYHVDTWCQEGYRLYCPRIVRVSNKAGVPLFETQNHWVIMDVVKGRPERPSYLADRMLAPDKEKHWCDPALPKFEGYESFEGGRQFESFPVSVTYFDYDRNKHVNNISYVNWMLEAFPAEYMDAYEPTSIDTEWKKQCHMGDKLRVETTCHLTEENKFLSKVLRMTEDGTEEVVFHAISEWKKKEN